MIYTLVTVEIMYLLFGSNLTLIFFSESFGQNYPEVGRRLYVMYYLHTRKLPVWDDGTIESN